MAETTETRGEAHLIEHLVGSVLGSIVKAQGLAASQLIDLVDKVGFEPAKPGVQRRARAFSFDFFRSEIDPKTNKLVRNQVTASVPLLTLINLPSIAIQEAKVEMDLRLVAHETAQTPSTPSSSGGTAAAAPEGALKLFVVPSRKQLVRTGEQAIAIDSAGTIRISVTMRQEPALGLDKLQSMLESATAETITTPPEDNLPTPAEAPKAQKDEPAVAVSPDVEPPPIQDAANLRALRLNAVRLPKPFKVPPPPIERPAAKSKRAKRPATDPTASRKGLR